jgi:hypothetical protein
MNVSGGKNYNRTKGRCWNILLVGDGKKEEKKYNFVFLCCHFE